MGIKKEAGMELIWTDHNSSEIAPISLLEVMKKVPLLEMVKEKFQDCGQISTLC